MPCKKKHTKEELKKLLDKAIEHVGDCSFQECKWFYRNKPESYFVQIRQQKYGKMSPIVKDMGGDRGNPINDRLAGIFFSASGSLPPRSPYGPKRFIIQACKVMDENCRMFFSDFFCNNPKIHHVQVVLVPVRQVARLPVLRELIELDISKNNFLKRDRSGIILVTNRPRLWVEVFYTSAININEMIEGGLAYFQNTRIIGKGTSTPGGIPKCSGCTICNVETTHPTRSVTVALPRRLAKMNESRGSMSKIRIKTSSTDSNVSADKSTGIDVPKERPKKSTREIIQKYTSVSKASHFLSIPKDEPQRKPKPGTFRLARPLSPAQRNNFHDYVVPHKREPTGTACIYNSSYHTACQQKRTQGKQRAFRETESPRYSTVRSGSVIARGALQKSNNSNSKGSNRDLLATTGSSGLSAPLADKEYNEIVRGLPPPSDLSRSDKRFTGNSDRIIRRAWVCGAEKENLSDVSSETSLSGHRNARAPPNKNGETGYWVKYGARPKAAETDSSRETKISEERTNLEKSVGKRKIAHRLLNVSGDSPCIPIPYHQQVDNQLSGRRNPSDPKVIRSLALVPSSETEDSGSGSDMSDPFIADISHREPAGKLVKETSAPSVCPRPLHMKIARDKKQGTDKWVHRTGTVSFTTTPHRFQPSRGYRGTSAVQEKGSSVRVAKFKEGISDSPAQQNAGSKTGFPVPRTRKVTEERKPDDKLVHSADSRNTSDSPKTPLNYGWTEYSDNKPDVLSSWKSRYTQTRPSNGQSEMEDVTDKVGKRETSTRARVDNIAQQGYDRRDKRVSSDPLFKENTTKHAEKPLRLAAARKDDKHQRGIKTHTLTKSPDEDTDSDTFSTAYTASYKGQRNKEMPVKEKLKKPARRTTDEYIKKLDIIVERMKALRSRPDATMREWAELRSLLEAMPRRHTHQPYD